MDLDKLNIQGMLDKFRQTKDGIDKTFRDIFASEQADESLHDTKQSESPAESANDAEAETETKAETEKESETKPEHSDEPCADESEDIPEVCRTDTEIYEKLDAFAVQLTALNESVEQLRKDIENSAEESSRSRRVAENTGGKISTVNDKLGELSMSLAGVSKLKDSIFDLKNSQINTKNSIGIMQKEFFSFKKKITTGVVIISILAAVTAILEIINLLS